MAIITITTHPLIEVIDQLTAAQIETKAVYMMAHALPHDELDALQKVAVDIDNSIELAKDSIQRLIDQACANQAEGHGNG